MFVFSCCVLLLNWYKNLSVVFDMKIASLCPILPKLQILLHSAPSSQLHISSLLIRSATMQHCSTALLQTSFILLLGDNRNCNTTRDTYNLSINFTDTETHTVPWDRDNCLSCHMSWLHWQHCDQVTRGRPETPDMSSLTMVTLTLIAYRLCY